MKNEKGKKKIREEKIKREKRSEKTVKMSAGAKLR